MKVILENFYKKRPVRIYSKIAPTLRADRLGLLVLVTQKSTNTPAKSIKNISLTTKTMETSQKSLLPNSPTLNYLSADFLAKHLVLLEKDGDLTTQEELYSLTSLGYSKKNDQDCSYWKTSKGFYLMTMEELSKQSSLRLLNWGMTANGKCLTAKISASRRIGKECSLSDILEEQVDQKYFLSQKAMEAILRNSMNQDTQITECMEQTE